MLVESVNWNQQLTESIRPVLRRRCSQGQMEPTSKLVQAAELGADLLDDETDPSEQLASFPTANIRRYSYDRQAVSNGKVMKKSSCQV